MIRRAPDFGRARDNPAHECRLAVPIQRLSRREILRKSPPPDFAEFFERARNTLNNPIINVLGSRSFAHAKVRGRALFDR